jgi:hypothetical protein
MLDKDLRELLALFRSKGVEFLVVGGHAVAYHGHPRLTEDLDLFVRPDAANGERIIAALREFGFGSLDLLPPISRLMIASSSWGEHPIAWIC